MKRILAVVLILTIFVFAGCSAADRNGTDSISVADANGKSLPVSKNTVTVTKPGIYTVIGTFSDGQLIVECHSDGEVVLVFKGADISCSFGAPVYIKESEKTIIELSAGSENTVTDNRKRTTEDPNAAIFSHDDLKIIGEGSLTVNGNKNNGITSKDKLTIEGGVITVNSENHGIRGKDRLKIEGGAITVTAGTDGLRATNDTEADRGEVLIEGGSINITAGDDAIYAYNMVNIVGGNIVIDTDNNAVKAENSIAVSGGTFEITTDDKDFSCQSVTVSPSADIKVNGVKQTY